MIKITLFFVLFSKNFIRETIISARQQMLVYSKHIICQGGGANII